VIKATVDLAVEAREAGEEKVILFDLTTEPCGNLLEHGLDAHACSLAKGKLSHEVRYP